MYYACLWLAPLLLCQWWAGFFVVVVGVTEFLHFPFPDLESFVSEFFCFFSLISILSSSYEILSSTCSSLVEWLSSIFFTWLKEYYISRISVWFFFLRLFISLLNSSFTSCAMFFISLISHLFFYHFHSFILEFVEILSEFI
jgi:hypothetical protein